MTWYIREIWANYKVSDAWHDMVWIPPYNTTKEPQVVTATINSALSRKREPESDPVRLLQ